MKTLSIPAAGLARFAQEPGLELNVRFPSLKQFAQAPVEFPRAVCGLEFETAAGPLEALRTAPRFRRLTARYAAGMIDSYLDQLRLIKDTGLQLLFVDPTRADATHLKLLASLGVRAVVYCLDPAAFDAEGFREAYFYELYNDELAGRIEPFATIKEQDGVRRRATLWTIYHESPDAACYVNDGGQLTHGRRCVAAPAGPDREPRDFVNGLFRARHPCTVCAAFLCCEGYFQFGGASGAPFCEEMREFDAEVCRRTGAQAGAKDAGHRQAD
jgi:hypothetical protein